LLNDITEMGFDFVDVLTKTLIAAGIFKFLRGYLDTATLLPKLDNTLRYAWIAAGSAIFFANLVSFEFLIHKFYFFVLLAVVYILYLSKASSSSRLLLVAALPILGFVFLDMFLSYLMPDFHKSYSSFLQSAEGFTICWLIGFGVYAQRQNKREKSQREKDEAERKILEAKKNELETQVAERTAELTQQKEELEQTLIQLKATQNQLIQSEKLASLGELTAGIAHEIQNPLNFVNNFSELSVDLAKELNEELDKDLIDKGLVKDILSDLTSNQDKINHHGKRASNIVKGMLEHSRTSSGVKTLTDINALIDESVRLSFHGTRAKDKTFNADFKMDLDNSIAPRPLIAQDFGRVLLNLCNNAFYAVRQKQLDTNSESYTPSVFVSSKRLEKGIELRVTDNGNGIPENIKQKVFQPFFTTKPTGEGTGLGLSLSYDIVTKGHGGSLEIETKEGEYTTFIIKLP
jgi:two-component system, NtrC family, sensor kinase